MATVNTAKNDLGEIITPGRAVDRLDNYRRSGRVLVINAERGGVRTPVLVRWPGLLDEWTHPGILRLTAPLTGGCYIYGCTRNAGWLDHDEEFGDMDACAEHAGYEDWEEMQAELDAGIAEVWRA